MNNTYYFDANCFIAVLKDEQDRMEVLHQLFQSCERGEMKIIISTLVIAEVLNLEKGKPQIPKERREAARKIFSPEYIEPIGLNRRIAEYAQDIVWDYDIAPKDAVHIATAICRNAKIFYTYDKKLINKKIVKTALGHIEISEPQPPAQSEMMMTVPTGLIN
jgi:predicted nucleic acid-binding protein